jgi:hypothetical protein
MPVQRVAPTPPQPAALRRLPWHAYAGSAQMEGGGKKVLSGGQVLGSFAIVVFVVSAPALLFFWFSGDYSRASAIELSKYVGPAAVISGVCIPLGFGWHARSRRGSKCAPDVLGVLFPHAHLMESGAVQLAVFTFPHAHFCRVVAVVQNRYDRPVDLRMKFDGDFASTLSAQLPGAGVVVAWRDRDMSSMSGRYRTHCAVRAKRAGRLARVLRRNLMGGGKSLEGFAMGVTMIGSPLDAALQIGESFVHAASAAPPPAWGHVLFADLAGVLPMSFGRGWTTPAPDVSENDWTVEEMWTPASFTDLTDWAEQLARLLGPSPLGYAFPFTKYSADAGRARHRV